MPPRRLPPNPVPTTPARERRTPRRRHLEAEESAATPIGPQSHPANRHPGQEAVLRWQQVSGNRFVQRSVLPQSARVVRRAPKLGSALDSHVVTQRTGPDAYTVSLRLDDGGGEQSVAIATYQMKASVVARQLPIEIEDFVTDDRVRVRIRYVPQYVEVTSLLLGTPILLGHKVELGLNPVAQDDLLAGEAAAPKRVGATGYVSEGSENVTTHLGSGSIDTVIASIASAEGGFASVEASDRGVFTWGQGQWTVTGGELQRVLAFIKQRRPDLWDRYWGGAGLDLTAGADPQFVYGGTTFATNVTDMKKLFRPNRERNLMWTTVFAQAGMDPQIQRLQREFMRGQVDELLKGEGGFANLKVKGKGPGEWLDTRGQAFYFSMWVNAPAYADQWLKAAVNAHGGGNPVDKAAVAAALEESFRTSDVKAWQDVGGVAKHHVIAFWGTTGKTEAVNHAQAQADALGPNQKDAAGWTKAQWLAHKQRLEHRQSRYEKTAADVTAALARTSVEPDVPPDIELDFP